jgi:hypothetical protein
VFSCRHLAASNPLDGLIHLLLQDKTPAAPAQLITPQETTTG